MSFPKLMRVTQEFPNPRIDDVAAAVAGAVVRWDMGSKVKPGQRVAITAGSRGIRNIVTILKTVVDEVKRVGGEPFLVAAMGSHGGGTARGMLDVLQDLGIMEETVGAPIESSEQVVDLGQTASGLKVYCAREAAEADWVIVVNRVKTHTCFRGDHESGLLKMLSVGLGRAPGAAMVHSLGPLEMSRAVPEIGEAALNRLPVLGGLAIVENGNEETAMVEGFQPREIIRGEKELLIKAKELLPGLPVDELDFLIVREMGKNFSGTGMDTNVIGRWRLDEVPDPQRPSITRVAVLDLSAASHGNANGIGLADFTTRRLFEKIDFNATYLNGLTTNFLKRIMLPIILPTDRDVVEKGLASLRLSGREPRLMIINNTLHLNEFYASHSLEEVLQDKPNITILEKDLEMNFDKEGNLQL